MNVIRFGFLLVILNCLLTVNSVSTPLCKVMVFQNDSVPAYQYIREGIIQSKLGHHQDAKLSFSMAVKIDSSNWMAWRFKGLEENELFDYNNAIESLTRSIYEHERVEKDTISWLTRGMVYYVIDDIINAIIDETHVIKLFSLNDSPVLMKAHFWRGKCYERRHAYKREIQDWTFVISHSLNPGDSYTTDALGYRSNANFELRQYKDAIIDVNSLSIAKKTKDIYRIRGISSVNLALDEHIIEYADSSISDLKRFLPYASLVELSRILFWLGIDYAIKSDSLTSTEYFEKAKELAPEQFSIDLSKGDIELVFRKDYKKAIYYYQKVLGDNNYKPLPLFYRNLGTAKINVGDTTGAFREFEKGISLYGNFEILYEARFMVLASLKYSKDSIRNSINDSVAIHDLTELIRLSKDDSIKLNKLYLDRAAIYSGIRKGVNNVLNDMTRAIEVRPDASPFPYFARATLRLGLSKESKSKDVEEEILKDVEKAISLDDRFWGAYMVKAYVLKHFENNLKASCACVKKAISKGGQVSRPVKKFLCNGKIGKGLDHYSLDVDLFRFRK